MHRHLVARVATARELVRSLEASRHGSDVVAARLGATLADARRTLARERDAAEQRTAAQLRSARQDAERIVARAEHEARELRAVAVRLGTGATPVPKALRRVTGPETPAEVGTS